MSNYIGYFRSVHNDYLYSVRLISNPNNSNFIEILLSGDKPFTVEYKKCETLFDPVRTSYATISIVHNDYLEDILPNGIHDTQVILYNETKRKNEWVGYLTPKMYEQDYVNEYEDIELNASDCVTTLENLDYELISGEELKGLVSFHTLLKQICDRTLLDGFVWSRSKRVDGTILLPTELKISEQNFLSSDTDEPWKLSEVLEEMMKYLGCTAVQWGGRLYIVDYQTLRNNEQMSGSNYLKSNNYNIGATSNLGFPHTITAEEYMGSNASITFKPVFNKVTVNDNFYDAEYFIPNIFDDECLTNRINPDEFYANYKVEPEKPYKAQFPKTLRTDNSTFADDVPNKDSKGDQDYTYFHRLYDHKYWESVYHTWQGSESNPFDSVRKSYEITRDYMGGTIVDLGVARNEYLSEYQQWIVPNKLDYTRYLCLNCEFNNHNHTFYSQSSKEYPFYNGPFKMFKLKDGYTSPCVLSDNSFLIINYSIIWERYNDRAYINPDWKTDSVGLGALQSGMAVRGIGNLNFSLKIGDKYWNGNKWVTTASTFQIVCEKTSKQWDVWNEELKVLNNVKWDLFVNESGYKIPLDGIDTTQTIEFAILRPSPQFQWNSGSNKFHTEFGWNAYCWVKDFSIKCVQGGQDAEVEESDVIYENVIDENSVMELDEIRLKMTTYTNMTKPSYSNVVFSRNGNNKLLETISEASLSGNAQKPEENLIERYVMQYNTPTKEFTIPLGMLVTPFTKVYSADVDNRNDGYCVIGASIDYLMDTQIINLEEKK